MTSPAASNISDRQVGLIIDKLGFVRKYKVLLIAASIGYLFDAFDNAILGYALPAISQEFEISPLMKGLIISAAQWGGLVGQIVWGPVTEAMGRLFAFRGTLFMFAVLTGFTVLAWNPMVIGVTRFLAGMGLGAFVPVVTGVVSEMSPTKYRGRFTSFTTLLWPFGSLAGAFLSLMLLPIIGWRGMFLLGSIVVILAIIAPKLLPESPRWLASKGRGDEALKALRELGATEQIINEVRKLPAEPAVPIARKTAVSELFSQQWRKSIILGGGLWITLNYAYLAVLLWLPSILVDVYHLTLARSLTYTVITALVGLFGRLLGVYLIEVIGRKPLLYYTYAGAALSCLAFGNVTDPAYLLLFAALFFFFADQASVCVIAYVPELFPTRIRLVGATWAAAAGRFTSALAPIMAGALMAAGQYHAIWVIFALMYVVGIALVWALGPETKGRQLEELYAEK